VTRYHETLYSEWGQHFERGKTLFEAETDHQHLIIFDNPRFGHVMALDGVIQTTEADEFVYHEMMVHVPMNTLASPRRVLIIGGGDGGILREVLKHPSVESVTQVEIDRAVIDMCVEFFPNHSQGAFNDPRLNLVIDDGATFIASNTETYDVIITDSTDPIGPGEVLFEASFYQGCANALNTYGILVVQNGVPYMQGEEVTKTYRLWKTYFATRLFYLTPVPTYAGGAMAMGFASKGQIKTPSHETLLHRTAHLKQLNYYTPQVHLGAFGLPKYVLDLMID
jgi:spermidine synthase